MIMPKKILFADLDDTLFQSRRKCPDEVDLQPTAYLKDGSAHSFQTQAQAGLLNLFLQEMLVIPVTARNVDAYKRVDIRFDHGAIVNFGGVILTAAGLPDENWIEKIRPLSSRFSQILEDVKLWSETKASQLAISLRIRLIEDHGLPFYVSIKALEGQESDLDPMMNYLRLRLVGLQIYLHRNGNNIAVIPEWLNKRAAVEYMKAQLREDYGQIVTIGMGDSLSDLSFMQSCDYSLIPNHSQIMLSIVEQ
jgi:hydroxymethylpyrimidine pyrophosphatase-like HAD family hydrolase